ncbi:hypothetical protein [Streptomyces sp. NPDC091268]|uniref:hypothetical protein n=1 Tax=Streptomyces sp. NPDC091268 TaxID=3365979 RepID=UPI003808C070
MDGLAAVHVQRDPALATGPAAAPVVLDGVDLFGYPAAEVLAACGPEPHPTGLAPAPPSGHHLPAVRLSAG